MQSQSLTFVPLQLQRMDSMLPMGSPRTSMQRPRPCQGFASRPPSFHRRTHLLDVSTAR